MIVSDIRKCVFLTTILCLSSLSRTMANLARSNEEFGKSMYGIVAEKEGNLICSPISAHIVLSMAAAGACCETKNNMLEYLHVKDVNVIAKDYGNFLNEVDSIRTNLTLDLANKIFVMKNFPLKPEFSKTMTDMYRSDAQTLDFSQSSESAHTINSWVQQKTNDKIKDLIKAESLTQDTRLVLVNAIYFKGNWAKQFKKEDTREEPFYLSDGSEVKCNMMHITGKYDYMEHSGLQAKILKMDYTDKRMSMVFFLPNERNGLKQMEQKLQTFDFQTELSGMNNWEIIVSLPKFKIESTIELTDVLKTMGMTEMFSDSANFSGISTSSEALKVSEVIQKAFVEVNEEGAEAAAATAARLIEYSLFPAVHDIMFVADHPFMVALMYEQKLLFLGRVVQHFYYIFFIVVLTMVGYAFVPMAAKKMFVADHPFMVALVHKQKLLFLGRVVQP